MEFFNRELSWLSFNARVLQEASDTRNPLIERMRFLGIYSNNLDEFFRVRVANLRRMIAVKNTLKNKNPQGFEGSYKDLFKEIRTVVVRQQQYFEVIYQDILQELEEHNIYYTDEHKLNTQEIEELKSYFHVSLKHAIIPIILNAYTPFPRLRDSGVYLAIKMTHQQPTKVRYALIEIPSNVSRFYLMKTDEKQKFILIDDIIRLNLHDIFSIFPYTTIHTHTFKFTRDAELTLDDDISLSLFEKIARSVKLRKKGTPIRFVYDQDMPIDMLEYLLEHLSLQFGINTIAGGRYHNFKDFMSFPDFGSPKLIYDPLPPLNHILLEGQKSLIKVILKQDVLIHYPYHRFDYLVDLLREAAIDPRVKSIKINVYRVTRQSQVLQALVSAVNNGKNVTVFMELMARFDEENNLYWSNQLTESGAKVLHGTQDLKVHSKLLQITRINRNKKQLITHIGTGNFHEKSARIYSDISLLTADDKIGQEVERVFDLMESETPNFKQNFKELLVSPINIRNRLVDLIKNEISTAQRGEYAEILLKLNNLTDTTLIKWLYKASNAGVKIKLIVRGICCLVPNVNGQSENIEVYSIVDRFLEHARICKFYNNKQPLYFISSADWMERNLDKRIEVTTPIKNKQIQQEIDEIFTLQLRGNVKTRIIGKSQKNKYKPTDGEALHTQMELYHFYASKLSHLQSAKS